MNTDWEQQNSLQNDCSQSEVSHASQAAEEISEEASQQAVESHSAKQQLSAQQSEVPSQADLLPDDSARLLRQKKHEKILSVLLIIAVVMLVVSFVLRFFVISGIAVSGDSMLPNFKNGETVWVNKCAAPQRGDVVVFYRNDVKNKFWAEFDFSAKAEDDKYYKLIKRVVALAGDKLWVEKDNDDYVLVVETPDGKVLRETYYTVNGEKAVFYDSAHNTVDVPLLGILGNLEKTTQQNPYIVPQDCFYAMGDNRHISNDSRRIGAVPYSRLYGVVIEK